jgi:hypothetical protein
MSKPANRGSLMGLKPGFPTLPQVAAVATTPEMEERILGQAADATYVSKDVFTAVKTDEMTARPAKKEPTVLMNAKLPVSLHARLKRTAQFNDISMTDILIRAIEAELATGRYAAPPEAWGSAAD